LCVPIYRKLIKKNQYRVLFFFLIVYL
jgi:hypothetical protein